MKTKKSFLKKPSKTPKTKPITAETKNVNKIPNIPINFNNGQAVA